MNIETIGSQTVEEAAAQTEHFPAWRYSEAANNVATVDRAVTASMGASSLLVRTGVRLIYPVPYAGDEQPTTYVRPTVDEFWLTKPA